MGVFVKNAKHLIKRIAGIFFFAVTLPGVLIDVAWARTAFTAYFHIGAIQTVMILEAIKIIGLTLFTFAYDQDLCIRCPMGFAASQFARLLCLAFMEQIVRTYQALFPSGLIYGSAP